MTAATGSSMRSGWPWWCFPPPNGSSFGSEATNSSSSCRPPGARTRAGGRSGEGRHARSTSSRCRPISPPCSTVPASVGRPSTPPRVRGKRSGAPRSRCVAKAPAEDRPRAGARRSAEPAHRPARVRLTTLHAKPMQPRSLRPRCHAERRGFESRHPLSHRTPHWGAPSLTAAPTCTEVGGCVTVRACR